MSLKYAQKCSEIEVKNSAKFHSSILDYSVIRIFRLGDALSEILELAASPEEGQQLLQKDRKEEKGKARKTLSNKTRKAERRRSLSRPKLWREEMRRTEKPLKRESETTTNSTMMRGLRFEPGPHWLETGAVLY